MSTRLPEKGSPERTETRWVITGTCGLYTGQELTRRSAIRKHCTDLYIIPSPRFPTVLAAWKLRRKAGDRAVRAIIIY